MTTMPSSGPSWRAFALGLVLVALMTAPTVTRLTSVARVDTNDGRFSIWNIAWIGHAIVSPDATILDANIFSPHTGTLSYSELNLVAGLFGLPWYVATGRDPVAALNGAVYTALVLAFVLMAALVRRLTGSEGAALVAATAYTFCPYMGARTAHIQLLMVFVFPMVLLGLHRLVERPGWWRGIELGVLLAVAALSCGYYGIFAGLALGLMTLVLGGRVPRVWLGFGATLATAGAIVYPVFRAYEGARALSGSPDLERSSDDALDYSANVAAYLTSGAYAHEWWLPMLSRFEPWRDVLFPGVLVVVFATATLAMVWQADRLRQRTVLAYAALAGTAAWASFGPRAGLYLLMYHVVPGMAQLRVPSRLGILVTFSLVVLASFAVARLTARVRWAPIALVLLLLVELGIRTPEWGWPSWPLRAVPPVSPAHQRLATLPRGVVVEYPFPYVRSDYHNHGRAMFWSAYHWQPLVNGYSDVIPPDFDLIALPINAFPDEASFAIMKARNVRYVVWNLAYYRGGPTDVLRARLRPYAEYLRPVVQTPDEWLFEIVKWPS